MIVQSYGGGVQSIAMALMSHKGLIEPIDIHIFADTEREKDEIYENNKKVSEAIGKEIIVVRSKRLKEAGLFERTMPLKIINPDGSHGFKRPICSSEFKKQAVRRWLRNNGYKKNIRMFLGFSIDEVSRMKDSDVKYITNEYPLIDLKMSRDDCIRWTKQNFPHIEPIRSACVDCPNRTDWHELKHTKYFQIALNTDEKVRNLPGMIGKAYLHNKRIPLADVDLRTEKEKGQLELFDIECMGDCGT